CQTVLLVVCRHEVTHYLRAGSPGQLNQIPVTGTQIDYLPAHASIHEAGRVTDLAYHQLTVGVDRASPPPDELVYEGALTLVHRQLYCHCGTSCGSIGLSRISSARPSARMPIDSRARTPWRVSSRSKSMKDATSTFDR